MVLERLNRGALSGAFFCPQSRAPDEEYLAGLHEFLSHNPSGQLLLREVHSLKSDQTWNIFATARNDIRALTQGPVYVDMLDDWAVNAVCGPLAAARSGIVALPLLVLVQIGQYIRYLEHHGLSHQDFLASVRDAGGLQGYCGGLPSAIAIACAKDETEVVKITTAVMRILLGVGAYGEAAEDAKIEGSTTLALRLKYEGQGEELTSHFPGTYVSAITDPKSISIVGRADRLEKLYQFARDQGLQVQQMDIRGKVHNPENKLLAAELCRLCEETAGLQLPDASRLQVPVRSNKSGKLLLHGSLTEEVVTTILASRCDWYTLLTEVAKDLKQTGQTAHPLVVFGMNDCVPMTPFHKQGLQATKTDARSLIQPIAKLREPSVDASIFSDDAIAVIGASCRLPGASSLEELWNMLAKGADAHQELTTDRFDLKGSFRASQSGSFTDRKFYGNLVDDVRRFDHSFFGVNPREATNMDPQQRILLELSFEALDAAGYLATHRREAGDNVGCFIGASLVEYLDNTSAHSPTAYTATGTIRAFLCGRLSHRYGWSGPAEVIDTACSSSLVAINRACKALQAGECPIALAGGINIITGMNNYFDLGKAGFLSPTGQCKPFDVSADGYCRSDGAGLVVLKKLKQAIAEGDQIMGVISGVATNQGGLSSSITVPHSTAQQSLYRNVLKQSGLQPEQVTYVEAHGTGTQAGDPIEMDSIRTVFGSPSRKDSVYVGSIKGNLGHCETAAGVASLLKVLAMIKYGQLPPQANHSRLNPKIPALEPDGLAISRSQRDWDVPFRAALVNSYGAAGSNCALLCCEMPRAVSAVKRQSIKMSTPLFISAASEKSLLENSRALARYLAQNAADIHLADVALTLNKRRQQLEYSASVTSDSVKGAADLLKSLDSSAIFKAPKATKPIVLAFSGQNNNKVALDKSLYDAFPIFRSYIDACDTELKRLGFPSIIPAIFQTEPISDICILQCSMVALQYACAMCWIDAGLQPSAIVGHSLGELAALIISNVLSLSDGLKLIASRARLIEEKWGAEKGAMLALNCTIEEFQTISSLVASSSTSNEQLEVACYNAETSIVAVGSSATIAATETIMRTQPSLQKIRFQRLDTSHGFHSVLVEPILPELASLAKSLQWNEPTLPLEICTADGGRSMKDYDVAKHARQSVYFSEAVQRIEKSLGSSLWIEAGINTPVINMARKASAQPDIHIFQALKTQASQKSVDVVGDVVSSLWRNGVFLAHWSFLATDTRECEQVWLPPYQFEKTQHWVANIDRVIEMRDTLAKEPPVAALDDRPPPPPQLISRKAATNDLPGVSEFIVNVHSERFRKIVGGHGVRSKSLCPASMYMESATMALQQILNDSTLGEASLVFEQLNFHAALGLEPAGEVIVRLEQVIERQSWKFSFLTSVNSGSKPRETLHGNGVIALAPQPMFDTFERLISGSIDRMKNQEDAEKLMSKRAYSLFSRVVDYADFFRGIHSITMEDWEAVASINIPTDQPSREESTSWKLCDTVTVDAFIQVVGLLMNSSDSVSKDEVMVMVGLDRAVLSPACNMDDPKRWQVYSKFGFTKDQQPVGDVFVCDPEGGLVATLLGCRFSKLPIVKLERALDSANSTTASSKAAPKAPQVVVQESSWSAPTLAPASTSSSSSSSSSVFTEPTPYKNEKSLELEQLLAEYLSLERSEIPADQQLVDLGLDSLAAVELISELSSKFDISIESDDLFTSSLNDLRQRGGMMAGTSAASTPPQALSVGVPAPEETAKPSAQPISGKDAQRYQVFMENLVEVSGANLEDIKPSDALADLGVDSLSMVDLKGLLEDNLSIRLEDFFVDTTVQELMERVGISGSGQNGTSSRESSSSTIADSGISVKQEKEELVLPNPFDALRTSDGHFNASASERGFLHYWADVAPLQDKLLIAYITEAFATLGVDLNTIAQGAEVPQVPHLTQKFDKLIPRLWKILQKHGIVSIDQTGRVTRAGAVISGEHSSKLHAAFQAQFPSFKDESSLIGLTGPRLADCLVGKADGVSIMFGSAASLKIMENFYGQAPMMSTMTEQLVFYLTTLLKGLKGRPVRILEVGAGTGGTTRRLAEALESKGIAVSYTFTDISPSLVSKAKNKFKQYPWIEYNTFNLEKEVPEAFREKFDIVISANCVHATSDRTQSCRRIREVLTPGGFIILSEVTHVIDWYDICFGLLDGWWLAEGRTAYPLQSAESWMSTYKAAGFSSMNYSQGPTPEANSQQLLVGCNKPWDIPKPVVAIQEQDGSYSLETLVYKEVDGTPIHADVYFPKRSTSSSPMPIALLIHGGGHMTLSRRTVRPAQTKHLLANGFLPVSIDYRLCPEVNLIDGPITDALDAYQWARTRFPQIAAQRGVTVDASKVVLVGWSSGGHLAMTVAWMAKTVGLPPPAAILSFYAPVDFESGELESVRLEKVKPRKMKLEQILAALPKKPITNYDAAAKGDVTELGWYQPGDPRSELVMSFFKEGVGLPVLLNELPKTISPASIKEWLTQPAPELIASISPLARLRSGQYNVPTFMIHGTADQIAPFPGAERFAAELAARGLRHGFLPLAGVDHIHDLDLKPGSQKWDTQVGPGYRFLFDVVREMY